MKKNISEDIIKHMYLFDGKSTYEIATILGVHRSTISNRLKKLGIESKISIRNSRASKRVLTQLQKEFIVGSLLGDGHVTGGKRMSRYMTSHSIEQKEYVNWLSGIFGDLGSRIKEYNIINKSNGKRYNIVNFNTFSVPELTTYRDKFYDPSGIKIIPNNIKELFYSPLSLAVLIMEDGTISKNIYRTIICTECFLEQDIHELVDAININFNLHPKLMKYNGGFRLRFTKQDTMKIGELTSEYIIPSMKYKIIT